MSAPGRNDPCPCGSGKKYKKCCLLATSARGVGGVTSAPAMHYDRCGWKDCGRTATGSVGCGFCDRRHAYCHQHGGDATTLMRGHILRHHPEEIPEVVSRFVEDESAMGAVRAEAERYPALWEKFLGYVATLERGEAPPPSGATDVAVLVRALRDGAATARRGVPFFRVYRGWKLGLSSGLPPLPTKEQHESLDLAALAKQFGWETPPCSYEEMIAAAAKADAARMGQWILSATLHPRGRASTQGDWELVDRIAAALGAPQDSLRTPLETTDPNDVHYWMWLEETS